MTSFDKSRDSCFWDKNSLLTKTARKTGKQYGRDWGLDQHLISYTRINSEWMNDVNIRKETINK